MGFAAFLEASFDHGLVALRDVAGQSHHESESVFGGGNGVSGRSVHDHDAMLGCGGNVNVVDTHAGTTDGTQGAGSCFDDSGGSFGPGSNDQSLVSGDQFYQYFFLLSLVSDSSDVRANIDFNAFGFLEQFDPTLCDGIGDENSACSHGFCFLKRREGRVTGR